MKKILIATTALVATAGVAAADVSVSGWAWAQARAGDAFVADGGSELLRGARIQFGASTETDGGLGLSYYGRMTSYNGGGVVATANGAAGNNITDMDGDVTTATGDDVAGIISGENGLQWHRVTLAYGGMTLDLGNANGAAQSTARYLVGYVGVDDSGVGVDLGLADNRMAGAHSDAGDRAVFKYNMGNVLVAASANLDGSGTTEVGVRYTDNGLTVGYAANNDSNWQALVAYNFGDVTVTAGANDADSTMGAIAYNMGNGVTVTAMMADRAAGSSYGFDVTYDLGGGASFAAQFGENAAGQTGAAAGIFFSF